MGRRMVMLELAVKSLINDQSSAEWTYSLYWRFSAQQRMLIWGDGFYNGPIKTTKTLHHPKQQQQQNSHFHRTHQLTHLYNSLSSHRRPSPAALSPQDLTHSEWFFFLSLSFSFPPGFGLPGKAFANNKHVWITAANDIIDTKIFSRAILAKSAGIKTVVCIPLMDGVVELGTTDKVKEDIGFIQHIKSIFTETQSVAQKPALSELSTSNSATSLKEVGEYEMDSDSSTSNSNSNAGGGCPCWSVAAVGGGAINAGEPSELIMQLELSEDIRLGSTDDPLSHSPADYHSHSPCFAQPCNATTHPQPPPLGNSPPAVAVLTEEDTHYTNTLSTLLNQNQSSWWPDSSSVGSITCSTQSAFSKWTRRPGLHTKTTSTSQCLLKNILHTIPFLHSKHCHEHNPSKSCDGQWQKGTSQVELIRNHSPAPHEKLNDKFIILRSIVPFATKMDKASILGDTVQYLKQLRQKIQDLEAQNLEFESSHFESSRRTSSEELHRNPASPRTCLEKRKLQVSEGIGDGCTNAKVHKSPPRSSSPTTSLDANLQVSIIGSDGLLELQSPYKEGLLLDILLVLQGLRIETTAVRSSLSKGVFIAELRAKVNENMDGKRASISEVKRAIQQIIPYIDT